MRFFDREAELAELHEIAARSEEVAQFTVVPGRRRVGKTSLVLKSLENETFVYLFVERKSEKDLCKSDARINLIVSGSVNTLMVKLFRNKKAPLYGRLLGCLILDLVQKGPDIYGLRCPLPVRRTLRREWRKQIDNKLGPLFRREGRYEQRPRRLQFLAEGPEACLKEIRGVMPEGRRLRQMPLFC